MSNKETAIRFQEMIVSGQIRDAYEQYVSDQFVHHNPYLKGDRESLIKGMEENQAQFPHKQYQVEHALEDGDMVALHARLRLKADMPEMAVVHLFRFVDGKIVEEWDLGQQMPDTSPNENGLF